MVTHCNVPVGVITLDNVTNAMQHVKDYGYVIPAFNCTRYALSVFVIGKKNIYFHIHILTKPMLNLHSCSSSTANTAMDTASKFNCPAIIQASNDGSQFFVGKSIKDAHTRPI